ncbi:alpha/beta hydrolase [Leptolyngbya sp. 15MV]|nr:alpha/beta hydrolase [Leptolyngbya sp. 15MV]
MTSEVIATDADLPPLCMHRRAPAPHHQKDVMPVPKALTGRAAISRDVAASRATQELRVADGTRLFLRDWGEGPPLVFLAGWSQPSDVWSTVMLTLAESGHRCVSYDRRGHGRSDDPGHGFDFDTLADDLAAVLAALDLRRVTLVGHSMAPGEIARYLTRHGAARVAGLTFVSPTTPMLARAPDNPDGLDPALFAAIRAALAGDFPAWVDANLDAFVTPNTSRPTREWLRGLTLGCSLRAAIELNRAIAEGDFRAELRAIRLKTLVVHGDADASAPIELCGRATASLIPGARLTVYPGAPHGLLVTHAACLVSDLVDFVRDVNAEEMA